MLELWTCREILNIGTNVLLRFGRGAAIYHFGAKGTQVYTWTFLRGTDYQDANDDLITKGPPVWILLDGGVSCSMESSRSSQKIKTCLNGEYCVCAAYGDNPFRSMCFMIFLDRSSIQPIE